MRYLVQGEELKQSPCKVGTYSCAPVSWGRKSLCFNVVLAMVGSLQMKRRWKVLVRLQWHK